MRETYDDNNKDDAKNKGEPYDTDAMNHDKVYTELPSTPPWLK